MHEIRNPQMIRVIQNNNSYAEMREKYKFLRKKKLLIDLEDQQEQID